MTFSLAHHAVIEGDVDTLLEAIDAAATQRLEHLMPQIFDRFRQVCDATGNVVDARGQPPSYDLLLQMLEKIELDFDEDGTPRLPTVVTSREVVERFRALPPPTAEQEEALRRLIERKREQRDARRHR